jgi:benzodiazapine receptor
MDFEWYQMLTKPPLSPPSWVFGPVWTVLYVMMAVSFYRVWRKGLKKHQVKRALKLFLIQLVLNLSWSPVFFGAKNMFLALVIIIFMLFFIKKTINAFMGIDKTAAYLLYPYIVWVSFATYLNFAFWWVNR